MKDKTQTENTIETRRDSRSEYIANLELQESTPHPSDSLNETLRQIALSQNPKNWRKKS